MDMMVSIIIPIYNSEKYLRRCIDSVLWQTYLNWELLLVNDGSKDASLKICMEYAAKDSRIKLISKLNGGVSSARNKGIHLAQGEFICFIDSDDYIDKDMIMKLIIAMNESNTDIIICGIKRIIKTKEEIFISPSKIIHDKKDICLFVADNYLKWLISSPCGKLYKRSLLPANLFNEEFSLGEDLQFNIEYFERINSMTIIDEPLYCYTTNNSSLTHTYRKKHYETMCSIYKYTLGYFNRTVESNSSFMLKNVNYKLFSFCISFMYQNINVSSKKDEMLFIKEICDNNYIREAIKELPRLNFIRKVYVIAIRHKCIKVLYLLSKIKSVL